MFALLDHAKSSVFAKLPPDLRSALDRAIIDRSPPTYRGLYGHFKLHSLGISFSALCRYAKRVRDASTLGRLTEFAASGMPNVLSRLPDLVGFRLLNVLCEHEPAYREIARMAQTYRQVVQMNAKVRIQKLHDQRRVRKEVEPNPNQLPASVDQSP